MIISTLTIKAIRLPKLRSSQARGWFQQNLTSWKMPQECGKKQRPCLDFLRWLWATCIAPIIEELGYGESPKLPRIWWIGVGIASLLSFHAAGNHTPESTENTFSRAISSYAQSIKALKYSRERVARSARKQGRKPRLLIVTMPTTPGQTSLPGVMIKEESEVQSIMKDISLVQLLPHPSATEILNGLGTCDIVHFACGLVVSILRISPEFLLSQLLLTACEHPSKTNLTLTRPILIIQRTFPSATQSKIEASYTSLTRCCMS